MKPMDIINMSDLLGNDTMGADIITAYDSTSHSSHKRVRVSGEPSSQPLPDFPLPLPRGGGGHSGGQPSVPLLTHHLAHPVQGLFRFVLVDFVLVPPTWVPVPPGFHSVWEYTKIVPLRFRADPPAVVPRAHGQHNR
ncbi:hypothetical protein ACP275_11G118000 [Erythranthe tilingii]